MSVAKTIDVSNDTARDNTDLKKILLKVIVQNKIIVYSFSFQKLHEANKFYSK